MLSEFSISDTLHRGYFFERALSQKRNTVFFMFQWWVKERAPSGTVVGVVQAHDLDGDGLTYRFIGRCFLKITHENYIRFTNVKSSNC